MIVETQQGRLAGATQNGVDGLNGLAFAVFIAGAGRRCPSPSPEREQVLWHEFATGLRES